MLLMLSWWTCTYAVVSRAVVLVPSVTYTVGSITSCESNVCTYIVTVTCPTYLS